MKKVVLVVKKSLPAHKEAERLREWLLARGVTVLIREASYFQGCCEMDEARGISEEAGVDLVVVLGGDGTLLYAARVLGVKGIPILGVNMGGLGFMTEISLMNLYPTLENVLAGKFAAEQRMMLSAVVMRKGRRVADHTVLNDAVLNKGALARILELDVRVDGLDLTTYRADGLIIATPTGSTAYNLSAGGPIVHPAHESIILTPICPFTLTNRPLILPVEAQIEVSVDPGASDVILTSDGQVSFPLEPWDQLRISRSSRRILLIKNPYKDYFEILRTKLGWGQA